MLPNACGYIEILYLLLRAINWWHGKQQTESLVYSGTTLRSSSRRDAAVATAEDISLFTYSTTQFDFFYSKCNIESPER